MIFVICNPAAGNGRGEKIGRQIEEALKHKGLPYQFQWTRRPDHATELAESARENGADTVLAIGGDGTAFEVARGLFNSNTALGIIPAGTGNDFVKTIGVPQDPLAALEHTLSHPPQKTDIGLFNDRTFLNEIGAGFDVMVLDYALKAKRYCRGLLPYLYGVLQTLFRFRAIPLTYTTEDGQTVTKDVFVIAVANGGVIGGGIVIAPDAKADDGLLDVVIVDNVKKWRLPARLIGLMQGKILSFPESHFARVRSISFSSPNMRLDADGEIISVDSVQARILPGALLIHR